MGRAHLFLLLICILSCLSEVTDASIDDKSVNRIMKQMPGAARALKESMPVVSDDTGVLRMPKVSVGKPNHILSWLSSHLSPPTAVDRQR